MHTATYDVAVASWMGNVLTDTSDGTGFPAWVGAHLGEGGGAALRREPAPARRALPQRLRRPGWRRPSSCTARRCPTTTTSTPTRPAARRTTSTEPAVAIIKHANPCGIAVGADVAEAHRKAHECDPVSAFGGVIATNRPVSVEMAAPGGRGLHRGVVAPAYDDGAVEVLAGQEEHPDPGVRAAGAAAASRSGRSPAACSCSSATTSTPTGDDPSTWTLATGEAASPEVLADLAFAWTACRSVKSNAILLAKDGASVGVGMGQVNRVDSCRLAVAAGGGAGGRLGRRVRRVLPVRGRPADPASTPVSPRSCSPAARCATS